MNMRREWALVVIAVVGFANGAAGHGMPGCQNGGGCVDLPWRPAVTAAGQINDLPAQTYVYRHVGESLRSGTALLVSGPASVR